MDTNTIFTQIASYKDPQLIPTLVDLFSHAAHPELVRAVVCWQHGADETIEDFLDKGFDVVSTETLLGDEVHTLSYKGGTVELIDVHYLKTRGACWARNKIQQHYNKEKYTLQLDSHHRFVESWDSTLIDMLESVRDVSPKPLLTAYVSSFDPENDPAGRIRDPWKMDFDRFIPEGAVFFRPSTIDNWKELDKPMLSRFYSGHFAFADGSFAEEVQHDPEYFFHGEEISIGVRAFTHGYDMYHPHRVVCWHEYTRKGRVKVWDEHTTQQKQKGKIEKDWMELNNECHERNRILFGMDGQDPNKIDFGKYGFGKVRTVKQFEEYAGMSFKYRGVQQQVLDKVTPSLEYKTYENEDEWKATIAKSNDIRVCIHKNDFTWFPKKLAKRTETGWLDAYYSINHANVEANGPNALLYNDMENKLYKKDGEGWVEANVNYGKTDDGTSEYWFTTSDKPEQFSEDFDFAYVGTHDEHGKEIHRKDLTEGELKNYLKNDWVDYRFIFMCDPNRTAKTYTVWPHSRDKGWLNKIDRLV
jgi:hypothetical protein